MIVALHFIYLVVNGTNVPSFLSVNCRILFGKVDCIVIVVVVVVVDVVFVVVAVRFVDIFGTCILSVTDSAFDLDFQESSGANKRSLTGQKNFASKLTETFTDHMVTPS